MLMLLMFARANGDDERCYALCCARCHAAAIIAIILLLLLFSCAPLLDAIRYAFDMLLLCSLADAA